MGNALRLNPLFLEWLMNWPLNWTSAESDVGTEFSRWETASSRRVRDMLSWYCSCGCWAERNDRPEPSAFECTDVFDS